MIFDCFRFEQVSRACARLQDSYCAPTKPYYDRTFRDFLAFLVLCWAVPGSGRLLAFMEFLYQNAIILSNIANYLAAIRANLVICGFPTHFMQDGRVQLCLDPLKLMDLWH